MTVAVGLVTVTGGLAVDSTVAVSSSLGRLLLRLASSSPSSSSSDTGAIGWFSSSLSDIVMVMMVFLAFFTTFLPVFFPFRGLLGAIEKNVERGFDL